jgi:hypothetical protein
VIPDFWLAGFVEALFATLRLWLALMLIQSTFIF